MAEIDLVRQLTEYIMEELVTTPPEGGLATDTSLIDAGILDSLALFKLIAMLEDRFGITVDPDDIVFENFATIDAIASLVQSRG